MCLEIANDGILCRLGITEELPMYRLYLTKSDYEEIGRIMGW